MPQEASDFTNGYQPWINKEWLLQEFQWMSTQGIPLDLSAGRFMATMMATVVRMSKCNRFDWQKNNFLHVQHTFLYISLLSLHGYGLRIPNFMLYGGRKQATRNFSFSFKTWVRGPQEIKSREIHLHLTFSANWNKRDKVCKMLIHLEVTFLLLLPSSMLKPPTVGEGRALNESLRGQRSWHSKVSHAHHC